MIFFLLGCSEEVKESKSKEKGSEEKTNLFDTLLKIGEPSPSEEYECVGEWNGDTIGVDISVPKGITIDKSGFIYFAATGSGSIIKVSPEGKAVMKIDCYAPRDVALDSKGNIYVVDMTGEEIFVYTPNGELLKKWGKGKVDLLNGIAIDSKDNVYVAGGWTYEVTKFTFDGEFISYIGKPRSPSIRPGGGPSEIFHAEDIAVDSKDNIYVASWLNQTVQKFSSNGEFLTMWGGRGHANGKFEKGPIAIAVDSEDNVYVADFEGDIQKFSSNGRFIARFGREYSKLKKYNDWYITDVAVDKKGNVYVVYSTMRKYGNGKRDFSGIILIFRKRSGK